MSVQATDFSILAIGISTLLVVIQKTELSKISTTRQICVCLAVWVVPLITSTTALALDTFEPVGNNWCWISGHRTDLRYGLTHGWRLAVIFGTVLIYAYIYWYFQRHFKSMLTHLPSEGSTIRSMGRRVSDAIQTSIVWRSQTSPGEVPVSPGYKDNQFIEIPSAPASIQARPSLNAADGSDDTIASLPSQGYQTHSQMKHSSYQANRANPRIPDHTTFANDYIRQQSRKTERDVRRMLLLNGYPLLYVVLWIPGIVSRLLEASGRSEAANSRVFAGLQAATQFVGLANSVTYGYNQQWRRGR